MRKYVDPRTRASHPGNVTLSAARLAEIEPELFEDRTFKCTPLCDIEHPASEMRDRLAEHLLHGDSRAAFVVSTSPLVVAAYSSDLDAVVLLRFPEELVARHSLEVGTRLLTVNVYRDVRSPTGAMLYAVDLVPGPQRTGWSNFEPVIAEFVSDDVERIEARKREISEDEWARAASRCEAHVARFGTSSARSGKPTRAGFPVRSARSAPYGRLDAAGIVVPNAMPGQPAPGSASARLRGWIFFGVFVAVALTLLSRLAR